jgi:Fe-S-cluster containining protein
MRQIMSIEMKLNFLSGIYRLYDQFMEDLDTACQKHCAHCCTANVSITTLEGYYLINKLDSDQRRNLKHALVKVAASERFRPLLTTNRIAELCRDGKEIPEDTFSQGHQKCPLLNQDLCPVYFLRPFGCRCFVSRIPCGTSGFADVDDFVLSVNTVFLQSIEHLDKDGCSGNLIDVLLRLLSTENRRAYQNDGLQCRSTSLIENQRLSVLMVPPEHQERLQPILSALNKL